MQQLLRFNTAICHPEHPQTYCLRCFCLILLMLDDLFKMLFYSTCCLFHVWVSLVTKVSEEELLNSNGEFFSCRNSQVWQVSAGLTNPGSPFSQLQPRFFRMRSYLHQKRLRKCTLLQQQGGIYSSITKVTTNTDMLTESITNTNIQHHQLSIILHASLFVEPPSPQVSCRHAHSCPV